MGSVAPVVIVRDGQVMVSEKALVVVPAAESVTRTVNEDAKVTVGVPESTPAVDRVSPVGNVPAERVQV